jgi:hypothetical protein
LALLDVHSAIEIKPTPLAGGTTRPLLVDAENRKTYVVKLFSKNDASQRCYTGAEVYAHHLATQFDLSIPDAVLITITPELIELVKKTSPDLYIELIKRDLEHPCFATEYLGNLPTYSPALDQKNISYDELASIYAFDALILNEDRKSIKPNILKATSNYFLIDHEKAFYGTDFALNYFKEGKLCPYSNNHLFYGAISERCKKNGNTSILDTFELYFTNLRLSGLTELRDQLSGFQYNIDDCELWDIYLNEMKQNVSTFVTTLRNSLL